MWRITGRNCRQVRGPGLESVQKGVGESEFLVLSYSLPGRDLSQKVTSLESTVEKREQALKTGEAEVPSVPWQEV
jgi:hypothetical protein